MSSNRGVLLSAVFRRVGVLCSSLSKSEFFLLPRTFPTAQRYNIFSRYANFFNDFFFPPLIRCSLRSRLCLCSTKFLYRMGSAYRLHRRTCYTKKEPPRRISEVLKVAATSSPTTQCSTIGDAVSLPCALAPLRCLPPLPAPLLSALSPAPARRRRAQPTPSATADTARASEAGLTTPELRLYRPTT